MNSEASLHTTYEAHRNHLLQVRGQVQLGVLLVERHHRRQGQELLNQGANARIPLQQGLRNAVVCVCLDQPQQTGHQNEVSDTGVSGSGHPATGRLLQQLLHVAEVFGQDLIIQRLAHCGDMLLGQEAKTEAA